VQRQHAFDTMFGHKVDTAAAGHWLPDLYWAMQGTRHQGNLAQLVATVWDVRRDAVMLPLMGERLLIKRLEDDLHLLFEKFHVGGVVQHRRPKRFHFARMIATANTKNDSTTGEDVGHRVVFGKA